MEVGVEILWREVFVDVDDWQNVVAGDENAIVTADDTGHVDATAETRQTQRVSRVLQSQFLNNKSKF